MTVYDELGGEQFFQLLIGEFYARVERDPELRAMYPPGDLAPAAERLQLFLEQYWGGPGTYSERRGHPRLRMRHATFPIDPAARERWLGHMRAALDTTTLSPELDAVLWEYLTRAAEAMVNAAI